MFTGITTNLGKVVEITKKKNPEFFIQSDIQLSDVKIGSSIMCSGICLTVVKKKNDIFAVNISEETISVTNAIDWKVGSFINLEKSLKLGEEIGGHLVTGHVDGIARLKKITRLDKSFLLHFTMPKSLKKFICRKGSITIDGVSLTVNEVKKTFFSINLIPHTIKKTTIGKIKLGNKVNIEIDILARYIDRNINSHK